LRRFGQPRTLDANERLWLVCGLLPGQATVSLNGTELGTTETSFAFDITQMIRPRNELAFVVASAEAIGEVALEVRGESEPSRANHTSTRECEAPMRLPPPVRPEQHST
jgi:hypothetical protein